LADVRFDGIAVRPIVISKHCRAPGSIQRPGELGIELPVAHRPVQVDEQSCGGGRMKWHVQCVGHFPRQFERTGIPAAVRVEQRLVAEKQVRIGRRDFMSAVLAADDQAQWHFHVAVRDARITGSQPPRGGLR
jgi:hypothetical protein